jgi:hypothetical protein
VSPSKALGEGRDSLRTRNVDSRAVDDHSTAGRNGHPYGLHTSLADRPVSAFGSSNPSLSLIVLYCPFPEAAQTMAIEYVDSPFLPGPRLSSRSSIIYPWLSVRVYLRYKPCGHAILTLFLPK